jgi:pre-mRNA-splicing helicase BRR2
LTNEQFSQLISLSNKITNYNAHNETMGAPGKEGEIDKEDGVMVVFDEEGFEIKEDSDEEDERLEDKDQVMAEEYKTTISSGFARHQSKVWERCRSPHSIDGFWVHRRISEVYPDPVAVAEKAASVLSIWIHCP